MEILLDTHAFIWFADQQQSANLPQATREILEDANNSLFLSLASVWEMAIKVSKGKLKLTEPVTRLVEFHLNNNAIGLLPMRLHHFDLIETLPFHHSDPFDRLLISQAQAENLAIVSIDAAFDSYGVRRIWLT